MISKILKRLVFPNSYTGEAYVKFLRSKGCNIGENVKIWSPNHTFIDVTRPYLLTIGDFCKITRGVTILTHDYSRSVIRMTHGDVIGSAKETVIGKNCFIGNNAIILMGSEIGDNCIIGAGAVVNKKFPDNVVIAGNPARVICSIDEYYDKRKKKVLEDAKFYAKKIFEKGGKVPTIENMGSEFFWLYLPRNEENISKYSKLFKLSGDDFNDVKNSFLSSKPIYNSFEDFLIDCGIIKRHS
jgi:acetyltransferase-like isoleucine patch superfamily enzyme